MHKNQPPLHIPTKRILPLAPRALNKTAVGWNLYHPSEVLSHNMYDPGVVLARNFRPLTFAEM